MTPLERKAKTENLLCREGIPYLPSLPCLESEEETELRTAVDIGIRIYCLFYVSGAAFHPDDAVFAELARKHGLWEHLSPNEATFLSDPTSQPRVATNLTWRCEAMVVLMWAVGLFDKLPLPREQTCTAEILERLPGAFSESPWPRINALTLRPKAEVLDASDLIYRLHWATRQAWLAGTDAPSDLLPSQVQEWHHAINWVTCYGDNEDEWDNVATDT